MILVLLYFVSAGSPSKLCVQNAMRREFHIGIGCVNKATVVNQSDVDALDVTHTDHS